MFKFFRGTYAQMFIEIRSNEQLGVLDTGYVEDYNGVDGQLSLYHVESGVRYAIPMTSIVEETPDVPNDFFRGALDLSVLPNGIYRLQGRVRDVVGNYSVINAFADSSGSERIINLDLNILPGAGSRHTFAIGPVTVRGSLSVPRRTARRETLVNLGSE